jgi:predicted secreted protein
MVDKSANPNSAEVIATPKSAPVKLILKKINQPRMVKKAVKKKK